MPSHWIVTVNANSSPLYRMSSLHAAKIKLASIVVASDFHKTSSVKAWAQIGEVIRINYFECWASASWLFYQPRIGMRLYSWKDSTITSDTDARHKLFWSKQECCWAAGLNTLASAKAFGATQIAITDVRDDNLPLAREIGAKHTLLTPQTMTNDEATKLLKSLFPPDGPDCVIDCAGYASTLNVSCRPLFLTTISNTYTGLLIFCRRDASRPSHSPSKHCAEHKSPLVPVSSRKFSRQSQDSQNIPKNSEALPA